MPKCPLIFEASRNQSFGPAWLRRLVWQQLFNLSWVARLLASG